MGLFSIRQNEWSSKQKNTFVENKRGVRVKMMDEQIWMMMMMMMMNDNGDCHLPSVGIPSSAS
jgi:hypothetical protein